MRVLKTRKVDELGTIVLPLELRREYNINEKSYVDICLNDDNQITLMQSKPSCKICGDTENLKELQYKNTYIRQICQQEISEL